MATSGRAAVVTGARRRVDRRYRIAVNIDRETSYGRGLVRGILRFARARPDVELLLLPRLTDEYAVQVIRDWAPTGVAFTGTDAHVAVTRRLGVPAVSLSSYRDVAPAASVHVDHRLVAREVFDHLHQRGLRGLACFSSGDSTNHSAIGFAERFAELARDDGSYLGTFVVGPRTRAGWTLGGQLADLTDWLRGLPRPLGLFCTDDDHGWRALYACRQGGIDVPGEVAVVSTTNDPSLCEACDPPLSSLDVNQELVGYRGIELLIAMLDGAEVPEQPVLTPSGPLVQRQSSDVLAVRDLWVARAVALMVEKLADGVDVDGLLDSLPISMSTLSRRFKQALGRTPGQVLRQIKLERVKQLLLLGEQPLVEIASATGYEYVAHLCRDFKQHTGQTPTDYRRAHHIRTR